MLTARENFLELLKGGTPERLVNQYEPFAFVLPDPLLMISGGNRRPGADEPDGWGTIIRWKAGEHAGMPHITDETKVCPDITQWRQTVKAPPIEAATDWTLAKQIAGSIDRNEKLVTSFMATGLFEQLHYLMGFEDTLCNFIMEPEAMHELLDYILDYKLRYAKLLIENIQPEVMFLHDDWGEKTKLFMSADTWREFFKPRFEKLHRYIKDQGLLVVHHADSHCESIVEDMVDVHIDVWQGVLPQNNIPAMQKKLGGRMLLMGGIDAAKIDFKSWDEQNVRTEVRRALDEYVPGGGFIPCITYGLPESIYPGVYEIITDEIANYGTKFFK